MILDPTDQLALIGQKLELSSIDSPLILRPFDTVPDEVIINVLAWMYLRSVFGYRRLNQRANELLLTKHFALVYLSRSGPSITRLDKETNQLETLFFLAPPSFQSAFAAKHLMSRHTIEWRVFLQIAKRTSFKASIPSAIGELQNLRVLNLQNVKGPIPAEIGQLVNLVSLSLVHCQINGTIPPQLFDLTELTFLNLHDCGLTGTLSPEISRLQKLQQLFLNINALEGSIPSSMGSMSRLVLVNLGWNQFSGSIPPELEMLPELRDLSLSGNKLNGIVFSMA